jgi:hypothetical protein
MSQFRDLVPPRRAPTVDGLPRSTEAEEAVNAIFRRLFSEPQGPEVLAYLQQITIQRVLDPSATDAELRHLEGMRALVAIITARATSRPKGGQP